MQTSNIKQMEEGKKKKKKKKKKKNTFKKVEIFRNSLNLWMAIKSINEIALKFSGFTSHRDTNKWWNYF